MHSIEINGLEATLGKAISALKRYADAWESLSQLGKVHVTSVSNAILTLSSASDNEYKEYKPGDLKKVELRGRTGLREARQVLEKARRVMDGMLQEMKWINEIIEVEGENQVVWWTVPAKMWKDWMVELVDMFKEDLRVKEWCLNGIAKLEANREHLYCYCASWLEMGSFNKRKLEFLWAAFEAERDACENAKFDGKDNKMRVARRTLNQRKGEAPKGTPPAISALLS